MSTIAASVPSSPIYHARFCDEHECWDLICNNIWTINDDNLTHTAIEAMKYARGAMRHNSLIIQLPSKKSEMTEIIVNKINAIFSFFEKGEVLVCWPSNRQVIDSEGCKHFACDDIPCFPSKVCDGVYMYTLEDIMSRYDVLTENWY